MYLFFFYECFVGMCIYEPLTCSIYGDKKKSLDPLEPELQMLMSHCVCWELKVRPQEMQQQVLLTSELSLQPLVTLKVRGKMETNTLFGLVLRIYYVLFKKLCKWVWWDDSMGKGGRKDLTPGNCSLTSTRHMVLMCMYTDTWGWGGDNVKKIKKKLTTWGKLLWDSVKCFVF